jgi:hypothetical protein
MYKKCGDKGSEHKDIKGLCTLKSKVRMYVTELLIICKPLTLVRRNAEQRPTHKGFADSGYVSVPKQLTTLRNAHSADAKELITRAKARSETFNSHMSRFKVLSERFRHGKGTKKCLALQNLCRSLLRFIVHYGMENGSLLFEL